MHCVVIGGSGFLGRNLIRYLLSCRGYSVTSIDINKPILNPNFTFFRANLTSQGEVNGIFEKIRCGNKQKLVVFQLAGTADKKTCELFPEQAVFSNITLTSYLLKASQIYCADKFIFPSTGLVYSYRGGIPLTEDSGIRVSSMYSAVKIAAEEVIRGWALNAEFQCFIARISNIYGSESSKDTVFGRILQQALKGSRKISLQQLHAKIDFVYIKDVANCLERIVAAKTRERFNIYNISGNRSYSVLEIAKKVCVELKLLKSNIVPSSKEQKISNRILSNKKAIRELGWFPEYSIDKGIRESIEDSR